MFRTARLSRTALIAALAPASACEPPQQRPREQGLDLTLPDEEDNTIMVEGIDVEVPARTDVTQGFPSTLAIEQGDVAFLIDTTSSAGNTTRAMANDLGQIVSDLTTTLPDDAQVATPPRSTRRSPIPSWRIGSTPTRWR